MHQKHPPAKVAFSTAPAAVTATAAMSVKGIASNPKRNVFMKAPSPRPDYFAVATNCRAAEFMQ
jgi:hypothetical protein